MPVNEILEKAAVLLRAHGINAFEQGDSLAIYAASMTVWEEVYRWYFQVDEIHTDDDPQEAANYVMALLGEIVATHPHHHDISGLTA